MDPELAKIRREAYLLHKRQRKVVEDSSSSDKPAAEAEVIDVDNFEEKITASWACDRCTFVNDFKRNSCEMCDHIHSVRSAADSSNASSKKAKTNHPCYVNGNILYDPHPRSTESGGWIWAENRSTSQKREDVSGLLSNFQALAAKSKISRDEVLQLAKQHNVTSGKWLLYQKAEYVAEVWGKIRDAMYEGKLGDVAKIAKDTQNGTFVICVYCNDFADRDDVSCRLLILFDSRPFPLQNSNFVILIFRCLGAAGTKGTVGNGTNQNQDILQA